MPCAPLIVHSPRAMQTPGNSANTRNATLNSPHSETRWASLVRFQPSRYFPADTKDRVILRLCDTPADVYTVHVPRNQATWTPSSNSVAEIFFKQGSRADAIRHCLMSEPVFVRFNGQLKSMRIPSLVIHLAAQEISLDWRQLCAVFMYDEFKCRFEANSLGSWSLSLRRNNP